MGGNKNSLRTRGLSGRSAMHTYGTSSEETWPTNVLVVSPYPEIKMMQSFIE